MNRAIANSTPLIALAITGHLDFLRVMFDEVIVAHSVYEESVIQGHGKPGANELDAHAGFRYKHRKHDRPYLPRFSDWIRAS